jgi:hypothetical protein
VLILRLKRCERALAGGRLDEAVRLLLPADARAHRRGQELLDRLVAALVERGHAHLAEGRLEPADADCHAAASLAGNTPPVSRLRTSIDLALADRRRADDNRRRAGLAVDQYVRRGQFTLARAVAQANPPPGCAQAGAVAEISHARASLDRLADDVAAALARGDWEAAAHRFAAATGPAVAADARLHQLRRDVASRAADDAARALDDGQLDRAALVLDRAEAARLGDGLAADLESLRRTLGQCQLAWNCVRSARYREAREVLDRLAKARPAARWITTASEELRRACESIDAVRGGTLGNLEAGDATLACPATAAALAPVAATAAPMPRIAPACARVAPPPPRASSRRFLLHVDGAGSFLVLRGDTVHVGPVSASRPVDLPLVTAVGSPTLTISRCDEDYFLAAASPVPVNDRSVQSKLLVNGDRIAVGPRGRIDFHRPNAASATAVLRVGGARLPWGGVREVLLMDREIVLGASAAAHVRVNEAAAPVILQAGADGRLLCRGEETVLVDGRPCGRSADVTADGTRVAVGALSFVVRWE